ncbi:hypothetical protein HPB51_009859 [Rhipicephalus microplus]|uniref:C2H2-type domain-containing protein n=1 Tax=Rhipicephalus microplus TaxID=6941 RepID=A0A9J6ETC9_RHIMP|nr:hypothetical protein HPB51_009859 [Rhipicephalus microplus]
MSQMSRQSPNHQYMWGFNAPHRCAHCKLRFVEEGELTMHHRRHHGLKLLAVENWNSDERCYGPVSSWPFEGGAGDRLQLPPVQPSGHLLDRAVAAHRGRSHAARVHLLRSPFRQRGRVEVAPPQYARRPDVEYGRRKGRGVFIFGSLCDERVDGRGDPQRWQRGGRGTDCAVCPGRLQHMPDVPVAPSGLRRHLQLRPLRVDVA